MVEDKEKLLRALNKKLAAGGDIKAVQGVVEGMRQQMEVRKARKPMVHRQPSVPSSTTSAGTSSTPFSSTALSAPSTSTASVPSVSKSATTTANPPKLEAAPKQPSTVKDEPVVAEKTPEIKAKVVTAETPVEVSQSVPNVTEVDTKTHELTGSGASVVERKEVDEKPSIQPPQGAPSPSTAVVEEEKKPSMGNIFQNMNEAPVAVKSHPGQNTNTSKPASSYQDAFKNMLAQKGVLAVPTEDPVPAKKENDPSLEAPETNHKEVLIGSKRNTSIFAIPATEDESEKEQVKPLNAEVQVRDQSAMSSDSTVVDQTVQVASTKVSDTNKTFAGDEQEKESIAALDTQQTVHCPQKPADQAVVSEPAEQYIPESIGESHHAAADIQTSSVIQGDQVEPDSQQTEHPTKTSGNDTVEAMAVGDSSHRSPVKPLPPIVEHNHVDDNVNIPAGTSNSDSKLSDQGSDQPMDSQPEQTSCDGERTTQSAPGSTEPGDESLNNNPKIEDTDVEANSDVCMDVESAVVDNVSVSLSNLSSSNNNSNVIATEAFQGPELETVQSEAKALEPSSHDGLNVQSVQEAKTERVSEVDIPMETDLSVYQKEQSSPVVNCIDPSTGDPDSEITNNVKIPVVENEIKVNCLDTQEEDMIVEESQKLDGGEDLQQPKEEASSDLPKHEQEDVPSVQSIAGNVEVDSSEKKLETSAHVSEMPSESLPDRTAPGVDVGHSQNDAEFIPEPKEPTAEESASKSENSAPVGDVVMEADSNKLANAEESPSVDEGAKQEKEIPLPGPAQVMELPMEDSNSESVKSSERTESQISDPSLVPSTNPDTKPVSPEERLPETIVQKTESGSTGESSTSISNSEEINIKKMSKSEEVNIKTVSKLEEVNIVKTSPSKVTDGAGAEVSKTVSVVVTEKSETVVTTITKTTTTTTTTCTSTFSRELRDLMACSSTTTETETLLSTIDTSVTQTMIQAEIIKLESALKLEAAAIPKRRRTNDPVRLQKGPKSKRIIKRLAKPLPICYMFATRSRKRSILVLPQHDLKRLSRRAGNIDVEGYTSNTKNVGDFWPYPCARPLFKTCWRYRLQTVKSLSAVSLLLRILWASVRWDEINIKAPNNNGVTIINTDTEKITSEIIDRRDVPPSGVKSQYLVRKHIVPKETSLSTPGKIGKD